MKLKGFFPAPYTPFHSNGKINTDIIPAYAARLKKDGVAGVFAGGTTGEGLLLTIQERKDIAEAWMAHQDDNFKVIIHVGASSIEDAKELTRHAVSISAHGFSTMAPIFLKPGSVTALIEFCKEIAAEAPDLPFYYYHIPVLNGVGFSMIDLLKEVNGKVENFAGIKYTHEDFMDYLSCLHFENKKYDMLWGRDENMLSALVLGAKGAVGSTYNYAAPLYSNLIDAFNKNDLTAAQQYQQDSIDMIRLLGKYGGIATGKAFMKTIGLDCGEFRLPIKNMSLEQFDAFQKDLESINFSTFQSKVD